MNFISTPITCALLLVLVSSVIEASDPNDYDEEGRLFRDKVFPINPRIRPRRNRTDVIEVTVAFNLVAVSEVDQVSQTLSSSGFWQMVWRDDFLTWDPDNYSGILEIIPEFRQTWRPVMALENTVDKLEPLGMEHGLLLVYYHGTIAFFPADTYKTYCKMDVRNFPFDTQECTYSVFAWGETIRSLDLKPDSNSVNLAGYNQNSEWDIVNTSTKGYHKLLSGFKVPFVNFTLHLRRKPSVKVLTVVMPVLLLSLLSAATFQIPVASGEKLSFAITVLLSYAVFMSFITNMLPQSADSLSVFSLLMAGLFVLSTLCVLLTIWVIRIYHRDKTMIPVPQWLQNLVTFHDSCCGRSRSSVSPDLGDNRPVLDLHHVIPNGSCEKHTEGNRTLNSSVDSTLRDGTFGFASHKADITWKRVSQSVDLLLFCSFLFVSVTVMTCCMLYIGL